MVVRIPTTLVALALSLALDAGVFALAQQLALDDAPIALLPLCALAGGFVSGRWAPRPAPVPGLSVGLMLAAVQIGLAFGYLPVLRAHVAPSPIMLQIMAAMCGGLCGTILARRQMVFSSQS